MAGRLSESQFISLMFEINEILELYWPCNFCWFFSHIMAVFTLGLSLLLPLVCISQLEAELQDLFKYTNKDLIKKGLKISLQRRYFSSWLEIRVVDDHTQKDWEQGQEGVQLQDVPGLVAQRFQSGLGGDSSSEDYDQGSEEGRRH